MAPSRKRSPKRRAPARKSRNADKVLKPVRPNVGIEVAYRKKLDALIEEMADSVAYWVRSAYRNNEPLVAQDELPASALRAAIRKLGQRWQKRFNEAAPKLAAYFATAVDRRSTEALKKILRDAGFTIDFRMTTAQRDIVAATVNQNVQLIRSIPAQYMSQVEQSVMRSVQTGRDLGSLTKELQDHYGVTHRRAAFIARSQNNMATAALTRSRQQEVGITEAIWVHSGGGREPRKTHLQAGREKQRYDVSKGWFDPEIGKNVWPGELPNCRCVSRAVVKGFS